MENTIPSSQTPPPPSPTHPEFSYTTIPLKTPATEIRLLDLFPSADFSSPLHCRLYTTPISSPAPYKALSYAWGSDDKPHQIYVVDSNNRSDNRNDADAVADGLASGPSAVNISSDDNHEVRDKVPLDTVDGKPKRCIIPITSSLDTCLRHLRANHHLNDDPAVSHINPPPPPLLTLWIDQLCIDQSNSDEKAVQVGLMTQIYSRARQVLIWLGPAGDGSDKVMDALEELRRVFEESLGIKLDDLNRMKMMGLDFFWNLSGGGGGGEKTKGHGGKAVEDGEEVGDEKRRKEIGRTCTAEGTPSTRCGGEDFSNGADAGNGGAVEVGVGCDPEADVSGADAKALKGMVSTTNTVDADGGKAHIRRIMEKETMRFSQLWVSRDMRAFFQRPWFTRVWVVQEAFLCANTVIVCGTKLPVSYNVCGAIGFSLVCTFTELEQNMEWQPWNPLGTAIEIVGERMSLDMLRALSSLLIQMLGTYFDRQRRLRQRSDGKGGNDLFELLVRMYVKPNSHSKVKLYRDRVYALLGLARDVDELKIKPNYSSQTKTAQILAEVAKAIIGMPNAEFPVEILSYSQFPKTTLDDGSSGQLPSWAPDWRSGLQFPFYDGLMDWKKAKLGIAITGTDRHASNPDKLDFRACGSHRSVNMVPISTAERLGLRGYLVDTIEEVDGKVLCEPFLMDAQIEYFEKLNRFWKISNEKNKPIYETRARRAEVIWRVPVLDIRSRDGAQRAKLDSALDYHTYRQFLEKCQAVGYFSGACWEGMSDQDRKKSISELNAWVLENVGARFYWTDLQKIKGRSLYLTKKGYIGMGPSDIEAGDVVVVFPGVRIPFVLRPTAEENTFTYIGDAYCDGIMDGEITLREEKRDFFLV